VDHFSWRWIFLINPLIAVPTIWIAYHHQGLVRAGRLIATDVDWITASSHGLVLEEDIAVGVLNSMYTLMAPLEMTPSMAP
jgi:hypothetical protein